MSSAAVPNADTVADRAKIRDTSALFELIPPFLCRPEQVAHWHDMGEGPTHKLLRHPVDLNELNAYKYCMAFWRKNGTLTYLVPHGNLRMLVMGNAPRLATKDELAQMKVLLRQALEEARAPHQGCE